MDESDGYAFGLNLRYRGAYGYAYRELERRRIGWNDPGRDQAALLRRLTAEAVRQYGDDPSGREAIEAGVRDAVEGRRPAW